MTGADIATEDGAAGAGADAGAEARAEAGDGACGAVGAFTMLSIQAVLSRKVVPDLALLIRTPFGSFSFTIWP